MLLFLKFRMASIYSIKFNNVFNLYATYVKGKHIKL